MKNTKYRVMMVDDVPESMDMLQSVLETFPYIEIVCIESNVKKAKYRLDKGDIDILFLDVVMPEFNGFTLLGLLQKMPATIICSGNNDFAYEAFDVEVIDFISKLSPANRVERALMKAIKYLDEGEEKRENIETSISLIRCSDEKEVQLDWQNMMYVSIHDDILTVYFNDSKAEEYYCSLSGFLDKVPPDRFIRIHRGFVVRIDAIRIRRNKTLVLWNWEELPIGASYSNEVDEAIKRIRP